MAYTVALRGLEGVPVLVEAVTMSGLPGMALVGLGDAAVGEAKERLRAGFLAAKVPWPNSKLTINMSPADLHKSGTGFDLALAAAVMCALGARGFDERTVLLGELGLDGSVRGVRGVIPAVLAAQRHGFDRVICAAASAKAAALVPGMEVEPISHLAQLARLLGVKDAPKVPLAPDEPVPTPHEEVGDLSDVCGQEEAIFGLTVAAAGGHHMLMVGPPGVGKSMLAERLPGVLPDLTNEQAVEVAAIQSLSGLEFGRLPTRPPLQSVHHTATAPAIVGGGSGIARPGAVTKAHCGVLYCDEFPEFSTVAIQSLREPLERGVVEINRALASVTYPARFQLVAAANPCRCGKLFDGPGRCTCTARDRIMYRANLGGPVRDRIDVNLVLRRPSRMALRRGGSVSSAQVRDQVCAARERQAVRAKRAEFRSGVGRTNADLAGTWLRSNTVIDGELREQLDRDLAMGLISMRAIDRILRLAWSVADLAGHDSPTQSDLYIAANLKMTMEGEN
ncbi:magnesium chelatase family protein [Arcanobacterium wilhelmae]|uniref:Magnesium chelatase family protein n=1 Tax=Arcanobacterium wilhelmae TaxID=1803177 RepID=A0ABT9N9Z4_9ACTO|nr:YifB family Mg chelatase-like AAA ATPase [Arcanobacterium wilhelmae]MDP9800325.1 magnesium chelatase family protein [Arcanobacterium wilhelmae]WFN89761.1 YifB family Mg chelatase-like AAA ATPase [Arcanobacterium wilhelmae]